MPFWWLEAAETVESIDGLRGIMVRGSAREDVEGFNEEFIVAEAGGETLAEVFPAADPSTGADTLRCTLFEVLWLLVDWGWVFLRASSLRASLVTALRRSSAAGWADAGTLFAGFGARTELDDERPGAAEPDEALCAARDKGEV